MANEFQDLPLDFPTPKLTVRPGPGQQGWQEKPDETKIVGGVYWGAEIKSVDSNDAANFVGSVK
jgi:hypothetical protein